MAEEALTSAESNLLAGLRNAIQLHGRPSLREIARCAGPYWYPSSVALYLRKLAAKGYVVLPVRHEHRGQITILPHTAPHTPVQEEALP